MDVLNSLLNFCTQRKDALTTIIAVILGLITLFTFIKALIEYRLQGRQKRAEHFDKLKTFTRTDEKISKIIQLIQSESSEIASLNNIDKFCFLGFYEQIAISVNSGLIRKDVAHYMFGYYALRCWESTDFWNGISKDSYYWSIFKKFAELMIKIEARNANKTASIKILDYITGRNNLKF